MRSLDPRWCAWLSWALLLGCARPGQERTEADREVGHSASDALSIDVDDGLAAVRSLEAGQVSLWANAPRLRFQLRFGATLPETLRLEVHNCMPQSVLDAGLLSVLESGRDAGNVCWFELGPIDRHAASLTLAPPDSAAPSPFRFALMSDVQEAINRVQDIYRRMNLEPDLDFLLGAGDLTEHGSADELERFQRELQGLDIPYYTTLGNHELRESPSLFQPYFGRCNESFEWRGVRFTLLDSASATIDPLAYDWLGDWLRLGADGLHIVAMHVPPRDPYGLRDLSFADRDEAAKLLARLAAAGVDLTLYGHIHSYYHFENAGIPAYISGGGGSHPERFDHIGRHFLVVHADPAAQTLQVQLVRVD